MTPENDIKKKMGRPIIGKKKDTRLGIRLDEDTLQKLEDYCKKKSLSKSDAIREALKVFLKD